MLLHPSLPDYHAFSAFLSRQGIGMTAAEMHGLLSGMLCGGEPWDHWKELLCELANNGQSFAPYIFNRIEKLYDVTRHILEKGDYRFYLWLPDDEGEDGLFDRADALSGWVNHFVLGLAMRRPEPDRHASKKAGEAIRDLRDIGRLGYGDSEDLQELRLALEEIIEYVRVAAIFCYVEFVVDRTVRPVPVTPKGPQTLH